MSTAFKLTSICYVLTSFPEPSETFIVEEALSLSRRGIRVRILALRSAKGTVIQPAARRLMNDQGVRFLLRPSHLSIMRALFSLFIWAPFRTSRTLFQAVRSDSDIRRVFLKALPEALLIARSDVELLHAHFAAENLRWAFALSEWTGIPYGVTTHRYDLLDDPLQVSEATRYFEAAALVVTISQYNRALMVNKYCLKAAEIFLIHCGIDVNVFEFRAAVSGDSGAPLRLLNVGRLVKMKGQDLLIEALAAVRKRGYDCHLMIIGGGPRLDALQDLAVQHGVAECITFAGAQPQEYVVQQLRQSDVFVLPSRSEGLPVACMEAMAVGVPLIATNISGIPELVANMETGILVQPEDVPGLADAIACLAQNRQLVRRMAVAGRQVVESSFERESCTDQLLAVMNRALASG